MQYENKLSKNYEYKSSFKDKFANFTSSGFYQNK